MKMTILRTTTRSHLQTPTHALTGDGSIWIELSNLLGSPMKEVYRLSCDSAQVGAEKER
jgi:hypothetical protein